MAFAVIGLLHGLTCGCVGSLLVLERYRYGRIWEVFIFFTLIARLFGYGFVWSGVEGLGHRRRHRLTFAAGVVAILLAMFTQLGQCVTFIQRGDMSPLGGDSIFFCVAAFANLAITVTGLYGGIQTIAVLQRPGVRDLFH